MIKRIRNTLRTNRGISMIEVAILSVVLVTLGGVMLRMGLATSRSERLGSTLSDAQHAARAAKTTLVEDLEGAGFGIDQGSYVPVEVASEFRCTFVNDRDSDGTIEPGERITVFVDPSAAEANVADTPNPDDYVIRRLVSTASDPGAVPGTGKGQILAIGAVQRTEGSGQWDVPLFEYLDSSGNDLLGTNDDPQDAVFGKTVESSDLGVGIGTIANRLAAVKVQVVTEARYLDSRNNKYPQANASGLAYLQNATLVMGSASGLWGGHIDVDTSHLVYPLGSGSTDAHSHEYDAKYSTTTADFFNNPDGSLDNIWERITDGTTLFKLIIANSDLSPAGVININGSTTQVTIYDNAAISSLPIYSMAGVPGTVHLTELNIGFDPVSLITRAIHPSNTGDVRKNEAGKFGEYRNGALTLQAIEVTATGTPLSPTNPSLSSGGVQGVATGNLLWESTIFWHWDGPSYHETGWDSHVPSF